MADRTGIEWTDASWNPVVGCSLVSPGCTNCYAMGQAARIVRCSQGLKRPSTYDGTVESVKGRPVWTGKVALASEATLTQPLRWKRPRRIFVNSMGDLFHEDVPDAWIDRVFAVMALAPQHTFQILTKRSARMRIYVTDPATVRRVYDIVCDLSLEQAANVILLARPEHAAHAPPGRHILLGVWPLPNVWLGVSAEDQRRADERIPDLLATPAAIRFVSAEPLLGPIDFGQAQDGLPINAWLTWLDGLDWIIVGGESGPNARPMHPDWARSIRDQCAAAGTAFFFKQHGEWIGVPDLRRLRGGGGPGFGAFDHAPYDAEAEAVRIGKARAGRLLDGVTHDAMPEARA